MSASGEIYDRTSVAGHSRDVGPSSGRRLPGLDGLRGVAVLLVVLSHAYLVNAAAGMVGVTAFFTLSGYLITGLLLRERERFGRIDLRAFYIRRALRLFPALVVVVTAVTVVRWSPGAVRDGLIALAYVQNVATAFLGQTSPPLLHTWSLAQEEQFYLIWPVVILLLAARRRLIVVLASLLAAASVGFRVTAYDTSVDSYIWAYYAPMGTAFALLVGCALATSGVSLPRSWAMPALCGLVLLGVWPWPDPAPVAIYGAPLAAALTAVVIGGAVQAESVLDLQVLRWVGDRSYGIYLWHAPIIIGSQTLWPGRPSRMIAAGLAIAVAAVSYRWVEQPFLRLKDRRFHRG